MQHFDGLECIIQNAEINRSKENVSRSANNSLKSSKVPINPQKQKKEVFPVLEYLGTIKRCVG